ncbi:hypothetical protein PM082_017047 [Marasmius tenuissimus]|nr:hypothetical protein PM082_017047 [Marasmius tenuissimus]
MSTPTPSPVSILTLLSTPGHILAYSLPLFFLSLVLTFAGAFLTLDRTRVFRSKSLDMPGGLSTKRGKFERWFKMEGGVGGVVTGWMFGFHLSTFLALSLPSLPNTKISTPLSSSSFLALYILVSLTTSFLGGRFKYVALTTGGLLGGTTFSLALSVITHPTLLTRLVFLAITTPILTLFTLLPLVRFQHGALRFALSSTGAFGLVTSIALLGGEEGDVQAGVWWCRLFVRDGEGWGTGKEKGLCVGYCMFLITGTVVDWALRRRFGECPDEKWDSYLASYTTNGNLPDRAGTFKPATSLWDRLTKKNKAGVDEKDPMIFPEDSKDPLDGLPPYAYDSPLKKHRRRTREAVKFRPLGDDGDVSSDDDDDDVWNDQVKRPWLRHATSSSASTLVGGDELHGFKSKKTMYELDPSKTGHLRKPPPVTFTTPEIDYDREIRELREKKKVKGMGEGEVPDYSDREEDITAGVRPLAGSRKMSLADSNASGSTMVGGSTPMAVPATPSLIKALDRVAMAQKDAFGAPVGGCLV